VRLLLDAGADKNAADQVRCELAASTVCPYLARYFMNHCQIICV
jgi:hypothetical protein